ncbi:Sua5/YciO/YrdC/YwlC family protein [Streptomyces sp. RFCAC02]|uniref:Sua5/YciO/YrdC/YwlC family protein n=1 Tax=Streptomyces sp. RFCAC02 TaxID=2499143 RepID=UPI001021C948|nr:Sua5/YciO/YrdC/YwlC family protein [Streptomyces sp. RFCAC02]
MNDAPPPRGTAGPAEVLRALGGGGAVVLPNPAPLTHVVAAAHAPAVNEAKGRPAGQPVALWAHRPDTLRTLAPVWDLSPADRAFAGRLLADEHLTVLLPLRPGAMTPPWLAPAARDGWTLLFGARWEPLRPVLDAHPVLYVSSANRTGHPPAATAAEARAMFPAAVPVLAPPRTPAPGPRSATTTVRLDPGGRLTLHRRGAQDRPYPDPDAYLRRLAADGRR